MEKSAYLTPPKYAKRLGVQSTKVLTWIRNGELRSIDVSTKLGVGRPRYRIPLDAIAEFENRRTVQPPSKPVRRRRRKNPEIIQYF